MMPVLKKLLYLATHRGIKENDIILGQFAAHCLGDLDKEELKIFEALLAEPDCHIYQWYLYLNCASTLEPPVLYRSLLQKIRAYHEPA